MLHPKDYQTDNIQSFLMRVEKDKHSKIKRMLPCPDNLSFYEWFMHMLQCDNRYKFREMFIYA